MQNQQFIEVVYRMTMQKLRQKVSQENSRQSCNKLGQDSGNGQPSGTGRGQNGEPETLA